MAELDKKISQLEEKASLTGEEYVALADGGRNYKSKVRNLAAGGQGTVLLHVDTGSATEDGEITTYRFTETQEEIDKIIDTFKDAEAATVSVMMGSDPLNDPMYSMACVRVEEEGIVVYTGIAVVTTMDGSVDMKYVVLTKEPQVSMLAVKENIIPSIQDYLVPNNFYTRIMRSGAYINTDGEYVENENFNVIDIYASGGGLNTPQYGTVVITNNDTGEATGISVFSEYSLKPVDYESPSRTTQVCFNQPYAQYASIHKNAKVFTYKSSVFAFMMRQVHKLQEMWNFFGIDIDSSIDIQRVSMDSEGAIADKYNNIHGEQVDKEADEGMGKDYFIFPLTLKAGDILTFDSKPGTTTDMAALKDANGNIIPAVPLNADGSPQALVYMTSKDINVELSGCGNLNYQKSNSFVFKFILQAINKTRDFMGINGRMQQLTPEVAQEGKYYNLSGEVADNEDYDISAPVSLKEGDTLLVKSLSFANVAMLKDADGNIVPARSTTQSSPIFYPYTATKATTVEISYRNDGSALFYKFNSSVFEQLAKLITANKGGDSGNLMLELPYLTGNFSTPDLGSGITDMPTLVAKIKAAKSVTLRNPSGASVACSYFNVHSDDTDVRLITVTDTLNQENVLRSNVQITYTDSSSNFFVNIVPETVQTYARVKLLAYKQSTKGVDIGMSFDELKALVNDKSKTIILANNDTVTADERVVIARLISDTGGDIYLTCAGADASAASREDVGNTFIRYKVSQNADDASKCNIRVAKVFSQERLLLKFPTFNGVWNVATLADGIDDMAALLDRLASHPVVLLQSVDNEFRQCLRYVPNSDEQRVYFYTVGNKINGTGGNIYSVFNVTYDTGTAQFHSEYASYPDENGGNVEIVTELPETPDENTVYIIKGS